MKTNKTSIFIILAAMLFSVGCSEDFLDQKSPDKLDSSTFWRSQEDAEAGLSAAYSQMETATSYWGFAEYKFIIDNFRSDYVGIGADAVNYTDFQGIYNFNPSTSNYLMSDFWYINYRGINYTNQVIEKVGEMDEDMIPAAAKTKILAEARFLRAYYHFRILLNWEEIVVQESAPAGEDELEKPLSTRSEAWDFIIADLEAAYPDLPWEQPDANIGRATKGSALGYLGKAALYRASEENDQVMYQKAADALALLYNDGPHELLPSFISTFNGTMYNNAESLLELQMTRSEDNGAWYQHPYLEFILVSEMGGWDEYKGTQGLLTEMMSEGTIATTGNYDTRLYESVFFQDPYFNDAADPRVYGSVYDSVFTGEAKIQFRKYLPDNLDKLQAWDDGDNIPILRYADALLMYAEALNALNQTAQAIPIINEVRARADMPVMTGSSQQEVFDQIVHERVMELTAEGWRYYDLRRWGMLESAMTAAGRNYTAGGAFFPIPEDETSGNQKID
jgi:starch-binding outer membrane protein, SusD/RagB family